MEIVSGIQQFESAFASFSDSFIVIGGSACRAVLSDGPIQPRRTLWARVPLQDAFATEYGVTDFHRILFDGKPLTFDLFNKEHERCMAFLRDTVNQSKATNRVIVTHHLPSFQLSSPDFKGSRINGAFVADEDDFIKECGAQYWIYGHSHRNIDKLIGKTQFVSNQLGYVFSGEHHSFDRTRCIDLG